MTCLSFLVVLNYSDLANVIAQHEQDHCVIAQHARDNNFQLTSHKVFFSNMFAKIAKVALIWDWLLSIAWASHTPKLRSLSYICTLQ